jgi:hypothetical protein
MVAFGMVIIAGSEGFRSHGLGIGQGRLLATVNATLKRSDDSEARIGDALSYGNANFETWTLFLVE